MKEQIPWSAEAERALRRKIRNTWFEMWICYVLAVVFGALAFLIYEYRFFAVGAFFAGFGLTRLYALALLREQLGEEMRRLPSGEFFEGFGMLANKPRITSRLTQWIQHPSDGVQFVCSGNAVLEDHTPPRCARLHHWCHAQWIPNYDPEVFEPEDHPGTVDPGGGRYVILCPCGLGHFKLEVLTSQDIVDRAAGNR